MQKHTFAVVSGLAAALTIYLMGLVGEASDNWALIMAPFGASCVIAFGLPNSPLARPKNIILGHLITTFVGLFILNTLGSNPQSLAIGVGLGITLMLATDTTHPPAGANPLLVILTGQHWEFLYQTVLPGSLALVLSAYLYKRANNKLSQSNRGLF
ncbi:HPP family protein [Vibrio brasiliensis]|jgi:CBS-domain-containing membrane protein|uniref:HPP family protein n=1 Tax=Vibrio brasiliensis TaxID=170652 RepID=UPI001EFE8052|nr:HPP family protein [Vibrio brasiliensis]MCG9752224.1 HPP family protein [Vibrio brasiliensis]MCG9784069.1 HPP family protein [Vibrio brasiliensis]